MDVAGNEPFEGEIMAESSDYTNYELLAPGTYTSASREVKAGKAVDKNKRPYIFAAIAASELQDESGATITLSKPLKTWIATFPRKRKNQQGTTSDVADYLRSVGFEPATLRGDELVQALTESASYPVRIVVGWTDMSKKLADGSYEEKGLRTADFNQGTPEEPKLVPVVNIEGVTYKAKHRISFFKRV